MWYVGPAMIHYRNWRFWIPETKKIRIGGTAKFLPTHCTMPTLTVQDEILKVTKELIYALGKRKSKNPISFSPNFTESIKKIAKLFHQHTKSQVATTEDAPAQRVESPKITTSIDATNKKHCKNQKQVHQKLTRSNTLITGKPVETLKNNCKTNPGTKLPRVELLEQGDSLNKSIAPLACAVKTTTPIIS